MRWFTFDVDFEMYGKDLIESAILSKNLENAMGKRARMVLHTSYF